MSHPHLTHATVVFNFSDGSRQVHIIGGGPNAEVEIETEADIEEIHRPEYFDPVALRATSWDVTFKITGITEYVPQPPTTSTSAEVTAPLPQVEP